MPRGVPTAGFRKTKKFMMREGMFVATTPSPIAHLYEEMQNKAMVTEGARLPIIEETTETDDEIYMKLEARFAAMETMTEATATGKNRALIISGPAGLGKSYGVMKVVDTLEDRGYTPTVVRGFVRPTGLYKTLYEFREKDCVIVFDDADSVFMDDVCLNLLKTACDMTKKRELSWLTETKMEDVDGERLPRKFEFEGSIIFITNYDFDAMIQKGTKLAPHFEAMISRSHYLDLAMKTKRDYVVRIKQVVLGKGMLRNEGFSVEQENAILEFIVTHQESLRELSLRMVVKLAGLMKMNPSGWEELAKVTCMK